MTKFWAIVKYQFSRQSHNRYSCSFRSTVCARCSMAPVIVSWARHWERGWHDLLKTGLKLWNYCFETIQQYMFRWCTSIVDVMVSDMPKDSVALIEYSVPKVRLYSHVKLESGLLRLSQLSTFSRASLVDVQVIIFCLHLKSSTSCWQVFFTSNDS